MTETSGYAADPWAWLHEADDEDVAALTAHGVAALIIDNGDSAGVERTERALDELTGGVRVVGVVEAGDLSADSRDVASDLDAEWLWFLPAGSLPRSGSLNALVRRAGTAPTSDVVVPLVLQPRRRGLGILIEEFGRTLSGAGRPATYTEPDEHFQGQLSPRPVLGGGLTGMLIRRAVFLELGGFTSGLPVPLAGLEFGWRANLSGRQVVAEPAAHVVAGPSADAGAAERRWGLALAATYAPGSTGWARLRLTLGCLLSAVGFFLGKDVGRARAELDGLFGWLGSRTDEQRLREALRAVQPTRPALRRCAELRPGWRAAALAVADGVAERAADWFATFTERPPQVSLDDLTGDDFAQHSGRLRRASPVLVGGLIVVVLAIVAGRGAFGSGTLAGPQLLPAQDSWWRLLEDYVRPLAGQPGVGAPAWLGVALAASLLTAGNVDALVTFVLVGCVPLAWFAAFRFLRRLLDDSRLAVVGGFVCALSPALVGGLNRGMFGLAVWSVLLPVLGYVVLDWTTGSALGWRQAGETGLLLLVAVSVLPLVWLPALVGLIVAVVRTRRRGLLGPGLLAVGAPGLLFLGPGAPTALAFPGRLLTGTDPVLAPVAAADPWLLAIGRTEGGGLPPLWLSATVFAVAWLAASVGAFRRPRTAGWALLGASGAYAVGVAVSHPLVLVAPGVWVRPQAQPWLVATLFGLTVAAVVGLDGLAADLAARSLGVRHAAALALAVAMGVTAALGAGWWAWGGESDLRRGPVGAVPAFVANAQSEGAASRTLAIDVRGAEVHWALLEDDFPRLGDAERGVAASGDPAAMALAADVTTRLVGGSADDQLLDDLTRLGVGNVWLRGGDSGLRTAIGDTPGLGIGTGDQRGYTWPVPDSARAIVVTGSERTAVGPGLVVPSGSPGRLLILAEPADPRWWATVDGRHLAPATQPDGRQGFALGSGSGRLDVGLDGGPAWWLWVQAAGLVVVILLALPELRRGRRTSGSRHLAGRVA